MAELTMENIEARLRGLKSIKDIVNSMKALSALSIRKSERLLTPIRTYTENIEDALSLIIHYFPHAIGSVLEEEGGKLIVVFTSEQGLCGVFNERIIQEAARAMDERTAGLVICGRKGLEEATSRQLPILFSTDSPVSVDAVGAKVMNLITDIYSIFSTRNLRELYLLFALHRKKRDWLVIKQRVMPPPFRKIAKRTRKRLPPLVYMDPVSILENLIREYIYVSLYRAFIESLASENALRLQTMERASRNIEDKFTELADLYNYLRQEAITNETIEILSGFEAMKK